MSLNGGHDYLQRLHTLTLGSTGTRTLRTQTIHSSHLSQPLPPRKTYWCRLKDHSSKLKKHICRTLSKVWVKEDVICRIDWFFNSLAVKGLPSFGTQYLYDELLFKSVAFIFIYFHLNSINGSSVGHCCCNQRETWKSNNKTFFSSFSFDLWRNSFH